MNDTPRSSPPAPLTGDTRDDILVLLKTEGASEASALAQRLGVTPVAVRQHLARLAADGLVDRRSERRPVGRPVDLWSATRAADERFPDAHAELAVDMLDAVEDAFGADGLRRLVDARTARQRPRYLAALADTPTLAGRVDALAALRRAEGYMAAWLPDPEHDDALLLVENHCPICAAALRCRQLCAGELALFRECLGEDVEVTRTEHILGGQRRCVYRVAPRG